MPQKITRNTFEGGQNQDITKAAIPNTQYLEARNLSVTEDGKFFGLQNLKGTTHLKNIITSTDTEILAAFENKYTIGGVGEDIGCITFFTINTSTKLFKIWAYDTENDTLYELFEETMPATYGIESIHGVGYAENGLDILYFTDNVKEIRKLRCEIPSGYSANFLETFDLSLQRFGATGIMSLSTETGGGLLCGAYQLAYQLSNPSENKYTRWSLLSNPIKTLFTESDASTGDLASGGVGVISDKRIKMQLTMPQLEYDNFTHFRVAVVENIYPTISEGSLVAYAFPLESISDFYISGTTVGNYYISSNASQTDGATQIPITDITVDFIALEAVKTLTIKYNRLLAGNIQYKDLQYNHPSGDPVVTGTTIIRVAGDSTTSSPYDHDDNLSNKVGYFRDEVYRFAISYFDEYGNFSTPKTLNLNGLSENQISGSYPDFKFPTRSYTSGGTYYTLFNSSNKLQGLGLRLSGINNHPKWAKGYVILRAKRKKNILWQSPFIPMMETYGAGAVQNYPSSAREGDPVGDVSYTSAQPMGPNITYLPKNLFWPGSRSIRPYFALSAGMGLDQKYKGDLQLDLVTGSSEFAQMFPSPYMYNDQESPYVYTQAHKLETVDACRLRVYADGNSASSPGLKKDIELYGTFFAVDKDTYYYDPAHGGAKAALRSQQFTISGYSEFSNGSEGGSINGQDILKYSNFVTTGFTWGELPDVQKCAVVQATLGDGSGFSPIEDGGLLTFASGGTVETDGDDNPTFVYTDSSVHSNYFKAVEIVNCVANLNDGRYGDVEAIHEFILTGAKYVFSSAELTTVEAGGSLSTEVDVWGGDCITTFHTFKLQESTLGITNQEKHYSTGANESTLISNWDRAFKGTGSTTAFVSVPVPYKTVAVYLQIALESEYNGSVPDTEQLSSITTVNTTSIKGVKTPLMAKTPLLYNYNINYSKENLDKIFIPVDSDLPVTTKSEARLIYSDTKIYQSNIEGFDTFRALNFYDLDETHGEIVKLVQAGNEVYSVQENAITYIPLGSRVIETSDADALAVRSGDYVNQPVYISTRRGGQNINGIIENGSQIFIPDNKRGAIYRLSGQQLETISDKGMASYFRNSTLLNESSKSIGFYDLKRDEYWLISRNSLLSQVWNNKFSTWVSSLGFGSGDSEFQQAVSVDGQVYVLGKDSRSDPPYNNQHCIYTMYTGNTNDLLGVASDPYIKFVVNEQYENPKTFDNLVFNSTDRLANCFVTVDQENALGGQTSSTSSLDIDPREGNYRVKVLRDSSNARLRGPYAIIEAHWDDTGTPIATTLNSVLTKYRISERTS